MVLATVAVVACAVGSQAATPEILVTLAVVVAAHGSRRTLSTQQTRRTSRSTLRCDPHTSLRTRAACWAVSAEGAMAMVMVAMVLAAQREGRAAFREARGILERVAMVVAVWARVPMVAAVEQVAA